MPRSASAFSTGLFVCLAFLPLLAHADTPSIRIRQASLIEAGENLAVQADIHYQLSNTAKDALHKGLPLTWRVSIEIRETGSLRDRTVHRQELPYRLRFHALLNQYEVSTLEERSEMFLTLNAALSYMSGLHDAQPIAPALLQAGRHYLLAIKSRFDRESLPVPLRPFAYLDSQWFLSSDWYLWPIPR